MPTAVISSDRRKYLEIARQLRSEIESGSLRPGDRLPTFVELRERFATTPNTVDRAQSLLEREGLIVRGQGRRGTHVAHRSGNVLHHVIGCIGFNLQIVRNHHYWMQLLAGMQQAADVDGFELLLGAGGRVGSAKLDGCILHGDHGTLFPDRPPSLPAVSVMLPIEGVPSVVADDGEATRRATKHLLRLGHRRIGAFMMTETLLPQRRLAGYRAALQEAGIQPDPNWVRPFESRHEIGSLRSNARLRMSEWMANDWDSGGVTAVLAQNDEIAIGIIDAARDLGLRVPDDLSVIGFDGTEEADHAALTSVKVPLVEIGAAAVELVLRQVRGEPVSAHIVTLPARLQVRGSTGPAKVDGCSHTTIPI